MNERIKKLRKALNLTQQEFAGRLNIGRGTLANYEVGRNEPIDAVVSLICREFNVNEEWLRTGEGEMFVQKTQYKEILDFLDNSLPNERPDFKRRFANVLSRLSIEQWEVLATVALAIVKDDAASAPAPAHAPTIEEEARTEAEEYYHQILAEKERTARSQVLPDGTGSDTPKMA